MELTIQNSFKKPEAARFYDKESGSFLICKKTDKPEGIEISVIFVPVESRGKGLASELLKNVIEIITADFPDWPVYLLAMPMLDCPMTLAQLISWYEKSGFVRLRGDDESMVMIYDPSGEIREYIKEHTEEEEK